MLWQQDHRPLSQKEENTPGSETCAEAAFPGGSWRLRGLGTAGHIVRLSFARSLLRQFLLLRPLILSPLSTVLISYGSFLPNPSWPQARCPFFWPYNAVSFLDMLRPSLYHSSSFQPSKSPVSLQSLCPLPWLRLPCPLPKSLPRTMG